MSAVRIPAEPRRVQVIKGKSSWELIRSSATWTTTRGTVVDSNSMDMVWGILGEVKADRFGTGFETEAEMGLAPTPHLMISVEGSTTTTTLRIGKNAPTAFPHVLPARYGRSNDRTAVFIIKESILTALLDVFSKLPR
jgi:hypothetical protein